MNVANLAFHGFNGDAAKKSIKIKNIILYLINEFERDIKIVTSTPRSEREMEISFSKHYNFHVTVDHDSGYMSNHQESNSDSSMENTNETLPYSHVSKPIYLSEDALLEKPEVSVKSKPLETKKDNDEKTRPFNLEFERNDESRFISTSPDTVLSTSVVSEETSYSGFDDTDSEISTEIPCSKQIIIENVDSCILQSDLNCHNSDNSLKICDNSDFINQKNSQNSMFSVPHNKDQLEVTENYLALNNITNTINSKNPDKKNKLTLIFSKGNKENIYSVKRKYQSTSPVQNSVPEDKEENCDVDKNFIQDKNLISEQVPLDNGMEHLSTTDCEEGSANYLHVDNEKIAQLCDPIEVVAKELNISNNLENSEKELILKKEIDLIEIILQQNSPPTHEGNEVALDTERKTPAGQAECDEQSMPAIATPKKLFENTVDPNLSPDLFENDEEPQEPGKEIQPLNYIAEEKYIIRKDQIMLKRTQNSLKGVFPPRSVTLVNLSIDEMLNRLETNKDYFWTNDSKLLDADQNNEKLNTSNESTASGESKSLLITGNKDTINFTWPQALYERYHGLYHNRSKISEELEELWSKYGQRYVGAETQSTCTVFETNLASPTKRKQIKRWAVKSPGRRLSHLAKRRITFSSANLQGGASSSIFGSRARQILVDAKKLDLLNRRRSPRKSPRKNLRRTPRKTPSKSPRLKSRTPSSSAKKKLAMRFRELTGEIEKTAVPSILSEKNMFTKRALFQSPDRDNTRLFQPSTSSFFENELKKPGTKRALFKSPTKSSPLRNSPVKKSPFKPLGLGTKRKRTDSDDAPPPKLARSVSVDIRPSESEVPPKFNRARSEMSISLSSQAGSSGELSAVHKKKLQWAVYEALRSQNITPAHPQFKTFASVLARVTRRFLPNLTSGGPKECGTTERMLRISRLHVYAVIKGKSVEEIISDYLRSRPKNVKPQGYIGPGEFSNARRSLDVSNRENIPQTKVNAQDSLNKKKLEVHMKPKAGTESRIDRIRKVINFGDDNR